MPAKQLEVHAKYACPRRDVTCGLCAETVAYEEMDDHKARTCPIRTVLCPNDKCYKRLPLNQMQRHAEHECRKRLARCLQGCGMEMPIKRLEKHMSERCGLRYVDCSLGCGLQLRAKDEWNHVENLCVRRYASGFKTGQPDLQESTTVATSPTNDT